MKITKVEGNGNYEYFQRFSNDPYLGKSSDMTRNLPNADLMPRPLGATIREQLLTKVRKLGKILVV